MIVTVILVFLFIICVFMYNQLVKFRTFKNEAFSGIEIQLKRRHNLVPNLVETVKGYASHEKSTLEEVISLRNQMNTKNEIEQVQEGENKLTEGLKSIFAIAENYPDLKADKNFLELQSTLIDIEDQLQYARRYFNGAVRNYNIAVQTFPVNFIAKLFHFDKAEFFEIDYATERQTPDVDF